MSEVLSVLGAGFEMVVGLGGTDEVSGGSGADAGSDCTTVFGVGITAPSEGVVPADWFAAAADVAESSATSAAGGSSVSGDAELIPSPVLKRDARHGARDKNSLER